jgi:hypothetical protein
MPVDYEHAKVQFIFNISAFYLKKRTFASIFISEHGFFFL